MKKIIILFSFVFLMPVSVSVSVSVLADAELSHQFMLYRIKEVCTRTINSLNYSKIIDLRLRKADFDKVDDEIEELFSNSLKYTYQFCSCVVESYLTDVDIEVVTNTVTTSRFWDEIVPRYSDGEGLTCSSENTNINLIKYE